MEEYNGYRTFYRNVLDIPFRLLDSELEFPADLEQSIEAVLERDLRPFELRVIRMRYGLPPEEPRHHSLREVAKEMGITNSRVLVTEEKVLRRMKKKYYKSDREKKNSSENTEGNPFTTTYQKENYQRFYRVLIGVRDYDVAIIYPPNLTESIDLILRQLPPESNEMVRMRYGLGTTAHTLPEVAEHFHMTGSEARVHIHSAIDIFRDALHIRIIREGLASCTEDFVDTIHTMSSKIRSCVSDLYSDHSLVKMDSITLLNIATSDLRQAKIQKQEDEFNAFIERSKEFAVTKVFGKFLGGFFESDNFHTMDQIVTMTNDDILGVHGIGIVRLAHIIPMIEKYFRLAGIDREQFLKQRRK